MIKLKLILICSGSNISVVAIIVFSIFSAKETVEKATTFITQYENLPNLKLLGFASGQSICNLSAKFDCDAVSASSFSIFSGRKQE